MPVRQKEIMPDEMVSPARPSCQSVPHVVVPQIEAKKGVGLLCQPFMRGVEAATFKTRAISTTSLVPTPPSSDVEVFGRLPTPTGADAPVRAVATAARA